MRNLIGSTFRDFRCCWRQLSYGHRHKTTFILLTPLVQSCFVPAAESGSAIWPTQIRFSSSPVGGVPCRRRLHSLGSWRRSWRAEAIVATTGQHPIGPRGFFGLPWSSLPVHELRALVAFTG
jgi:hypothetical protein